MSKNKTVRKAFFAVFCLFACVSLGYAESCSTAGQVQYKINGSCGTSERTCCLNRQWSEWDGSCPSCECSYGETKEIPCKDSDLLEKPKPDSDNEWTGNIKMTCDCNWKADTSACKLEYVFVKLKVYVGPGYTNLGVGDVVKINDSDEITRSEFGGLGIIRNNGADYIESEVRAMPNGLSYHIDPYWDLVGLTYDFDSGSDKGLYCRGSFSYKVSNPSGQGASYDYPFEFSPSCEWR